MTSDAHSHVDGFSRILVLKTISRTKSVKTGKGEKTEKRANGKETNGKEDPGSAMVTGQRYPYECTKGPRMPFLLFARFVKGNECHFVYFVQVFNSNSESQSLGPSKPAREES